MVTFTHMKSVLPVIVVAQLLCTSLWFAGNAVAPDLASEWNLQEGFVAQLTSVIQFGFITGTFVFAILAIADRFSPSRVFFVCSLLAAFFNVGITVEGLAPFQVLLFRFLTGFFLAGIYPVGMKIASDHFQKGLGKSLGFLVGALVLGTSFPHLLKFTMVDMPWKNVLFGTTVLSITGGFCILLAVPNGPYRKPGQKLQLSAFVSGFMNKRFRSASFGYFGHMWELYTFWAFVPVILAAYQKNHPEANYSVALMSFVIIGGGSGACVASGIGSQFLGVKRLAFWALASSALCCLVSPFFIQADSPIVLVAFLFLWGLVVIADSPLFSTLVAQSAPDDSRGSALTIVNCIGFSITIVSIQTISILSKVLNPEYVYMLLAVGPVLGLMALWNER